MEWWVCLLQRGDWSEMIDMMSMIETASMRIAAECPVVDHCK